MNVNSLTNKANREVCNVLIVDYATNEPYMYYEEANTTGLNISSDNVYARSHGTNKIAFQNPMTGEVSITAQVVPHKLYALFSDGIIDTQAEYYVRKKITCTTQGEIPLTVTGGTIIAGTVVCYSEGHFGDKDGVQPGGMSITYASGKIESADLVANSVYEVGFMVSRTTGVQVVALNNKRKPKDVKIYMDTYDKDENGNLVPYRICIEKASIKRNLDLNFSSDGDPQEVTITFDILEKNKDNFIKLIEITDEIEINPT